MSQYKIPNKDTLVDQQFIQLNGPDGLVFGYKFNKETCTLYAKESDVIIPSFHGQTHIAEDPVPNATTDTPGLMSASDKAKLETLTQTRLGVLGFSGAGFPDDGGFLQGDIILAAGTEFISLERIGNVVRFTVDSPLPLNCGIEECAQIFWIQDETDVSAIRPPACAGKLPDINAYGELKVYQLPESAILNQANPSATLSQKTAYPALIFKRYDDSLTPGQAEFELILARNSGGTTNVGWAMTPGAAGKVETVWFTGSDDDGNQIRFELNPENEADLLGSIFYKGHTLTRQMAVVTSYPSNILATNQYNCKFWSVNRAEPKGDEFVATNVWKYNNPENPPTDLLAPRTLTLDATSDVLPVGTLVQIWEFQIGEVNGQRLVQRFFSSQPKLNPNTLWGLSDVLRFGDTLAAREELTGVAPEEMTASLDDISDIRLYERNQWGLSGFDDPLLLSDDGFATQGTDEGQLVVQDTVSSIDLDGDSNNPTPNFIITAASAAAGSAFVTNELADRVLVFTSGLNSGISFDILENTASTITIFDPDGLANQLAVGDSFNVYLQSNTLEPSGEIINNQYIANISPALPGLIVQETGPQSDQERPVWVWHRSNHKNIYLKALIGRPEGSRFPPVDILLKAPIDNVDDYYMKVVRRGTIETGPFSGNEYIVIKGVHWHELPPTGTLRILTGVYRNYTWKYQYKTAFPSTDDDGIMLIGFVDRFPFDLDFIPDIEGTGVTNLTDVTNATEQEVADATLVPDKTTVVTLLREDYTAPALRLEFSVNDNTGAESLQFQIKAGLLDMSEPYDLNAGDDFSDDLVRGFLPGAFSVSRIHTQDGFITDGGLNQNPDAVPEGFKVYDGGFVPVPVDGEDEKWNELQVLYRDGQLWVWWNKLLVPPDPTESAALPEPVAVSTPYFPVAQLFEVGKVGLRLWPGALVREIEIRDQLVAFNEFVNGQLEISSE